MDVEIIKCWCGAEGTYEDLFCDDVSSSCYGTGECDCYCGGDQCVCHNHGAIECPGCEDCGPDDCHDDYDYSEDHEESK